MVIYNRGVETPFVSANKIHKTTSTNYFGGHMTIGEIAVIRTGLVTVRKKKKISSSRICEYRVLNLKCIADEGYINKNNKLVFADTEWECDVTQLLKDSKLDEEGYLISSKGEKYDLNEANVIINVDMNDIEISDNIEEGNVVGKIIQLVYKGDHYQYIIRTDDEEDFVVDNEWTWNEQDIVSIKISPNKMKLKLKGDIKQYEV